MDKEKNKKLSFYEVSEEYINYLKRFDDKVPNIKYETREKFVCGILFDVNGHEYYAPVSSFNKSQKTNHIIKVGEYPVGSIRFSFMFPVPKSEIKRKDFSKEDIHYRYLINSEFRYCKLHYHAIVKKAMDVYQRTVNKEPIYEMNCCDFKLLESKCKEWEIEHSKETHIEIAGDDLELQHDNKRRAEIIWGKDLEGAEDFARDLEVAQETALDIDEADIPNNTPREREGLAAAKQKAIMKVKEKNVERKEQRHVTKNKGVIEK